MPRSAPNMQFRAPQLRTPSCRRGISLEKKFHKWRNPAPTCRSRAAALCSGSFTSHFCASAQVFQGTVTTEYNRSGNRREQQGERMISMSPRSVDGCCSRQECGNNQLFSRAPACCHQARLGSQSHTSFRGVMAALSGTRRKRRRSHLGALQLP